MGYSGKAQIPFDAPAKDSRVPRPKIIRHKGGRRHMRGKRK